MRFAVVDGAGAVVNVIVASLGDPGFDGVTLIPLSPGDPYGIGWTWGDDGWAGPEGWVLVDGVWSPPVDPDVPVHE